MTRTHPDLKEDYFEKIDTKEKAYWLGYLFADGYIQILKNNSRRIEMYIQKKDEWLINKFAECINANKI